MEQTFKEFKKGVADRLRGARGELTQAQLADGDGNGMIVHAPRTGRPVSIDSLYYWIPPNFFARVWPSRVMKATLRWGPITHSVGP